MNRKKFERHLQKNGCMFHHRGGNHDIWWNMNTLTTAPVPRHKEVQAEMVRAICRQLSVPLPLEK